MEERAVAVRDFGEPGDRLQRADLVVRVHDRDEGCLVGDDGLEIGRLDAAAGSDRQQRGGPPVPGQRLQRVEDRFVLDRGRNEMASAAGQRCLRHAADGDVVSSVPLPVKITSLGRAPRSSATADRASSRAAFAA